MKPLKQVLFVAVPCALSLLLSHGCSADAPPTDEHIDDHESHRATEDHVDGHDHEDEPETVELTERQAEASRIETVVAGAGQVLELLTLVGSVAPNADAVLHVTPRVSGQVREVSKQLGETVTEGELLCVLDSVELGGAAADYMRDRELASAAQIALERARELYETRLSTLTRTLDGAIATHERIYSREEELQEKAVSTVRPLLDADKELQLARLERQKQLTELEAERDARLLALEADLRAKRIDETAAANRLRALGVNENQLKSLSEDSPLLAGEYRILAPGNGVVVNRHASAGEFVPAGSKLYIIEDLSSVWFVASAFEEELRALQSGQDVSVSLDAFPRALFRGSVSFLDYHVDPTSRSVGVRITLDNEHLEGWREEFPLRPGMFGRAEVEIARREAGVVLPEAALVHSDSGDYVFVQVSPTSFERREVEVRPASGGQVEILSGVKPGERVASTGTFQLKSAERQAELGGGHSH